MPCLTRAAPPYLTQHTRTLQESRGQVSGLSHQQENADAVRTRGGTSRRQIGLSDAFAHICRGLSTGLSHQQESADAVRLSLWGRAAPKPDRAVATVGGERGVLLCPSNPAATPLGHTPRIRPPPSTHSHQSPPCPSHQTQVCPKLEACNVFFIARRKLPDGADMVYFSVKTLNNVSMLAEIGALPLYSATTIRLYCYILYVSTIFLPCYSISTPPPRFALSTPPPPVAGFRPGSGTASVVVKAPAPQYVPLFVEALKAKLLT